MRRRTFMLGLTSVAVSVAGCSTLEGTGPTDETNTTDEADETDLTARDSPPTGSFGFEYSSSNDRPTIVQENGDQIRARDLYVLGTFDSATENGTWHDDHGGTASGTVDGEPAVTAGDSVTVSVGSAYDINVVWETDYDSATLSEDTGPEA